MDHDAYSDALIADLIGSASAVALVGASANPARASHGVMAWWLRRGARVFPVNPGLAGGTLLGRTVYPDLAAVPEKIDLVDVFRASEAAGGVVDEALAMVPLPRAVWMQLGVRDDAAAARAEAAGVTVVMDRCPAIEARRLGLL